MIRWQSVGDREVLPVLAVESRQTAAPGATPDYAVPIDQQRNDIVGVVGDVDTFKAHLDLLTGVVTRLLGRIPVELDLLPYQFIRGAEAVFVFDAIGVPAWTPISASDPFEHRECAFVLYVDNFNPVEPASWSVVKALYR